jgi:hypothetical protein
MRKSIQLTANACDKQKLTDFRQSQHNLKCVKKAFRKAQLSKKRNNAKNEKEVIAAHVEFIETAQKQLKRAQNILPKLKCNKEKIEYFLNHAQRQIEQIQRRVIQKETIPHAEKVFSLFKPYSRWISKGKAGVPVEFGLPLSIVEDQHQFILNYKIMFKESDKEIAVPLTIDTKEKFHSLSSCSFDKGYHSPENQKELISIIDKVIMPKKGRLSKERQEIEYSSEFKKAKQRHSAVESAINCLGHHGLDLCLDYGIDGFERYIGLAIVGRNIQQVGNYLLQNIQKVKKRQKHLYTKTQSAA